MKSKTDIYEALQRKEEEFQISLCKYGNLSQIEVLDSQGQYLSNKLEQLRGFIEALKWVLQG